MYFKRNDTTANKTSDFRRSLDDEVQFSSLLFHEFYAKGDIMKLLICPPDVPYEGQIKFTVSQDHRNQALTECSSSSYKLSKASSSSKG